MDCEEEQESAEWYEDEGWIEWHGGLDFAFILPGINI